MTTFTNAPPRADSNAQTDLLGRVHVRSSAEDGDEWVAFGDAGHGGRVTNLSGQTNAKGVDKEPIENSDTDEAWADFTDFNSASTPPPDGKLNDGDQLAPQKPVINDRRQKYGTRCVN